MSNGARNPRERTHDDTSPGAREASEPRVSDPPVSQAAAGEAAAGEAAAAVSEAAAERLADTMFALSTPSRVLILACLLGGPARSAT